MVGATPVFVDMCPTSLNLDPANVDAAVTEKTRAILAVEVFGNTTHMASLEKLARKHEVPLIEDCCEGLGGVAACGRPVGSFGRVGVFAFYPQQADHHRRGRHDRHRRRPARRPLPQPP